MCDCRTTPMEKRFVTLAEAAKFFGVSYTTICRLSRSGELPVIRLRGAIRVDLVAAEEALIARGVGSTPRSDDVEAE